MDIKKGLKAHGGSLYTWYRPEEIAFYATHKIEKQLLISKKCTSVSLQSDEIFMTSERGEIFTAKMPG